MKLASVWMVFALDLSLGRGHGKWQTRSDILQGQALFRGVKQLRRCLVMLNNFEKFSFPSIEKRWTKDKETDRQKEKRQEKTKKRINYPLSLTLNVV